MLTQADPLSCLSTHQTTDADDNRDQVVLRPDHFTDAIAALTSDTLEEDICKATNLDSEVVLRVTLRLLKEQGP